MNHQGETASSKEGEKTDLRSGRRLALLTLLQPSGAAICAVIALVALILATRQGQLEEIASYAAGAAVASIASVLAGGGTTLAYTTGGDPQRRAVRLVRIRIVLPIVAAAVAAAAFVYGHIGSLDPRSVTFGGASVLISVGAELDASFLRRHIRTTSLLASDLGSRCVILAIVSVQTNFAIAMFAGAVLRSTALRYFANSDHTRREMPRLDRSSLALAYEFKKTGLSILYSLNDRLGVLIVPALATVPVAGGFAATTSAQQSASGTLMTGLQTTLAARSHKRVNLGWANKIDLVLIATAFSFALVAILAQETVWSILALDATSMPVEYWIPSMLMVPASMISRVLEFRLLAQDRSMPSLVSRALATLVTTVCAAWGVAAGSVSLLAWGMVSAEVIGASLALTALRTGRVSERGT